MWSDLSILFGIDPCKNLGTVKTWVLFEECLEDQEQFVKPRRQNQNSCWRRWILCRAFWRNLACWRIQLSSQLVEVRRIKSSMSLDDFRSIGSGTTRSSTASSNPSTCTTKHCLISKRRDPSMVSRLSSMAAVCHNSSESSRIFEFE